MELDQNDQEKLLVEQFKIVSKEAFRSLYDTYAPKIHVFALLYLYNSEGAEVFLNNPTFTHNKIKCIG
jgi:hypothetical protein